MRTRFTPRLSATLLPVSLLMVGLLMTTPVTAEVAPAYEEKNEGAPTSDYRRLLPLEGGSNFRDMGGYPAENGKTVKRGVLFRSAAMTSLTESDRQYLAQFDFDTVLDLRSQEERDLYPNTWATGEDDLAYRYHDYSIEGLIKQMRNAEGDLPPMERLYQDIHTMLEPQLRMFFDALLAQETPLAVHCSAGQDRTGITSALLLEALGVPEPVIIEDYLLSTDFRRPDKERGDVNLEKAAEDNAFARLMLEHQKKEGEEAHQPDPLVTDEGTPYLLIAFKSIREEHGSIRNYLKSEIGLTKHDLERLRELYLT